MSQATTVVEAQEETKEVDKGFFDQEKRKKRSSSDPNKQNDDSLGEERKRSAAMLQSDFAPISRKPSNSDGLSLSSVRFDTAPNTSNKKFSMAFNMDDITPGADKSKSISKGLFGFSKIFAPKTKPVPKQKEEIKFTIRHIQEEDKDDSFEDITSD